MATVKKSAVKKASPKKAPAKKSPVKKTAAKKAAAPKASAKNKLGVKNSLVNNINARKKKNISRSKKQHTVSKDAYEKMEDNWEK